MDSGFVNSTPYNCGMKHENIQTKILRYSNRPQNLPYSNHQSAQTFDFEVKINQL